MAAFLASSAAVVACASALPKADEKDSFVLLTWGEIEIENYQLKKINNVSKNKLQKINNNFISKYKYK